jgi:hypothetical protein
MQVTIKAGGEFETVEHGRASSEDAPAGGPVGSIEEVLASARSLRGLPVRMDQINGNEDETLVNNRAGSGLLGRCWRLAN